MEFDIRCISEDWQSYVYRNWSYFQFFPNCSINHSPILTGISIFSRIFFWRTKNRLKVRTVIYLYNDNNKNRKSSRRKLGREFPGKTTLSFPNTRFALLQPTGSFSKYLQPCLDSISCAQIHAIRARVREPRDTFRDDRSRKSFHRLFFFSFFCENACVAYVGRSKWKASQRGADG